MATTKQINYVLYLLGNAGYSTKWMNAQYKELGAKMAERSGTVESWVAKKNNQEISDLIKMLQK